MRWPADWTALSARVPLHKERLFEYVNKAGVTVRRLEEQERFKKRVELRRPPDDGDGFVLAVAPDFSMCLLDKGRGRCITRRGYLRDAPENGCGEFEGAGEPERRAEENCSRKGGLGYSHVSGAGSTFCNTAVNLLTVEGLARMAIQQPLELLSLLPDIVPEVGLALWNSTFLACGPESVRIKAVTRRPDGGSEEAPEGTAAIKELWEKNPDEVGGLIDAFGRNYQMAMFAGMCAAEAVPGNRGKGVKAV